MKICAISDMHGILDFDIEECDDPYCSDPNHHHEHDDE